MKVAILGLGYVGTTVGTCLAQLGHEVVGIDIDRAKVDMINQAVSPIVEPELPELLAEQVRSGRLRATWDCLEDVWKAEAILICVGTPSQANGALNLQYVINVARDIGDCLKDRRDKPLVVVRSTVLPGTTETVITPIIGERCGKEPGKGFGLVYQPEFMREGSSLLDFYHPPKVVIGELDGESGEKALALNQGIDAPVFRCPIRVAEMIKYADNAFHALKVAFANEIGAFCKSQGVDARQVMDIFCHDRKLNISEKYLRPGPPFGGSCLPKDLRALLHQAKVKDVELPLLSSILPSNEIHTHRIFQVIRDTGKRKVGLVGLSFKAGTDDLRESPMVSLAETLLGKGYELMIHDREVEHARLIGSNKCYVDEHIPHLVELLTDDLAELVQESEVVVFSRKPDQNPEEYKDILVSSEKIIIDLVGVDLEITPSRYIGICW